MKTALEVQKGKKSRLRRADRIKRSQNTFLCFQLNLPENLTKILPPGKTKYKTLGGVLQQWSLEHFILPSNSRHRTGVVNNHQNVAWQPDKSEGEMSSSRVTRTDTDIGTIHGIFPIRTCKKGLSTSIVETAFTFSVKEGPKSVVISNANPL